MATKDGRAQIWYADSIGNVTGYTESVDEIAGTIIDAYNEHFGTDITIWTPETKTLQVGDTVPNWDAYEKIEMPKLYVAVAVGQGATRFAVGYIKDKTWFIYTNSNNEGIGINNEGVIEAYLNSMDTLTQYVLLPKLESSGYDVQSVEYVEEDYQIGETIPNVNETTFIE